MSTIDQAKADDDARLGGGDLARLRKLIKKAERAGEGGECPWCGSYAGEPHELSCPAFTPSGVVL